MSLWGLLFSDYNRNSPLDPNLLFAGQYYDEESGLTYNRFRYYDPETACYLNCDLIGLEGGSTPYFYVCNPWGFVNSLGLKCWAVAKKDFWKNEAIRNPHKYSTKIWG